MKYISLLFLTLSLSSCFSKHAEHAEQAEVKKEESSEQKRITLQSDIQENVFKIYAANFRVHQAFIAEEMSQVKTAAAELKDLIQQQASKTTLEELQGAGESLELMSSLDDSEALAEAFAVVNKVMVAYLLKYDLNSTFNVYYCPMVDKHWIQNSAVVDDVQNPYALYMLKCGTRETSFASN